MYRMFIKEDLRIPILGSRTLIKNLLINIYLYNIKPSERPLLRVIFKRYNLEVSYLLFSKEFLTKTF